MSIPYLYIIIFFFLYYILLFLYSWYDLRLSLQKLYLGLVIDKGYYKRKLTRFINDENAVRQASKAYASEGEDHNFF